MARRTERVAVNVYWNDDEWNFNANDFDNGNDWNEGNILLSFETAYGSLAYPAGLCFARESLAATLFFHPPSILPTSCIFSDISP